MQLIFTGYSVTNKRKPRFLTILGYFGRFLEMRDYNPLMFSGTSVQLKDFRLGLFRAFSDACFTQNNFLTELNSPISALDFLFATIFHNLSFVRIC